ncbi:hypothetical protein GH714_011374 [Hevea brasiliensis]|uniref:F-box domain-containing protein n=1 Tax=Hevea brasiliensis TaxID=3981 RepID=A0A6A6NGK6_HEVBR|nr:hypothetical protein GH714_011374 [Hevea brasiliensis]
MWREIRDREAGKTRPNSFTNRIKSNRIADLQLSNCKDIVSPHRGPINSLQVDLTEGRYLLSGASDASAACFDIQRATDYEGRGLIAKHKCLFAVDKQHESGHKFAISSAIWYPVDTGLFITGSYDHYIKSGILIPLRTAMSPLATSHMLIAAGTEDVQVRLCDIASGAFAHTLSGHRDGVMTVEWSTSSFNFKGLISRSKFAVKPRVHQKKSAAGNGIKQSPLGRTPAKGPLRQRLHPGMLSSQDRATAHYGAVTGLKITEDGMYLLSAGSDSRMRLWDVESGCNTLVNFETVRLQTSKAIQLATTQDSSLVFVPCMTAVKAFDVWSGMTSMTFRGHYEYVNCCWFNSQDQKLQLSQQFLAHDRTLKIQDTKTLISLSLPSTHVSVTKESHQTQCPSFSVEDQRTSSDALHPTIPSILSEMDPGIWSRLPEELLDLVLSLLPLKTFLNLRSTCKHFRSLIFSPIFMSKHSSSGSPFSSFLLLSHPQFFHRYSLYDSVIGTWRNLTLSLSFLLPSSSAAGSSQSCSLLSSSNGLLCFSLPTSCSFLVCNFLAKSSKVIEFPSFPFAFESLTFVSTPFGYKIFVLCSKFSSISAFIYDSRFNSWQKFDNLEPILSDNCHQEGVFFNGSLYFTTPEPFSIVCLDMESGKWKRFSNELPEELTFVRLVSDGKGNLYLIGGIGRNGISKMMKLWELGDGGNWMEAESLPEMMCRKFVSVCYHNYEQCIAFGIKG